MKGKGWRLECDTAGKGDCVRASNAQSKLQRVDEATAVVL